MEEQSVPTEPDEEKDYKEAARSTADYADYRSPEKPRNPIWRKLGLWALAGLAVVLLLAGGYWALKHHKSSKPSQSSPASTAKVVTATKHYDSANFNLGFDYPANWTIADNNGLLTVRSDTVGLKDSNGKNVSAQITMRIRQKIEKLPEFDRGNAVAARDSEKVAYTKPTQSQRANTYLSFLRYASSSGGFDGIYITGDFGYKDAQAIPKSDIAKLDPIIDVTFSQCSNSQCSGGTTPVSISTDNWDEQSFSAPLKAMLESLSIT